MKRIIVIEKDFRTNKDLRNWARDLNDEIRIEIFENEQAFTEKYFHEDTEEEKAAKEKEQRRLAKKAGKENESDSGESKDTNENSEENKDGQEQSKLDMDLVLIEKNLAGSNPIEWLQKWREKIKNKGYFPENGRTKFALLAFEGADLKIEKLAHPYVDDLFIKPLDRSLILQKIELLLSDEKNASFLYNQKTDSHIQMAKSIEIVSLSEYGFAVINPVALKTGTFMSVHSALFETEKTSSIIGRCHKVIRTRRYNGFLCYFSFFGINSIQLRLLRKKLSTFPSFRSASQAAQEDIKERLPNNPTKHIAIIEMSPQVTDNLLDLLSSRFPNTCCHTFPNYHQFLKKLAPPENAEIAVPDESEEEIDEEIDATFAYSDTLTFEVMKNDHSIRDIQPAPARGQDREILGHPREEILDETVDWQSLISSDAKDDFAEFLAYLESGQKTEIITSMVDKDDNQFPVTISGIAKTNTLKIEIKLLKDEDTIEKSDNEEKGSRDELSQLECIIINGIFIKGELNSWMEGLREVLHKNLNISPEKEIPIIILGEEGSQVKPEYFLDSRILNFFTLPMDRRLIMQSMAALVPYLSYRKSGIYLGEVETKVPAKVAQNVLMKEISEFGLTIQYQSRIRENVFLSFFSPIFGVVNYEGVLAKCYGHEETGNEDEGFLCHFIFFGVTDVLLKRIRSWIKEEYVAGKDSKG